MIDFNQELKRSQNDYEKKISSYIYTLLELEPVLSNTQLADRFLDLFLEAAEAKEKRDNTIRAVAQIKTTQLISLN